jgi:hypothetical protein
MSLTLSSLLEVPIHTSERGYWDIVDGKLMRIRDPTDILSRLKCVLTYKKRRCSSRVSSYVSDMLLRCEIRTMKTRCYSTTDLNFFRRFLRISPRLVQPLEDTKLYYLIERLNDVQRRYTVILSQRMDMIDT